MDFRQTKEVLKKAHTSLSQASFGELFKMLGVIATLFVQILSHIVWRVICKL